MRTKLIEALRRTAHYILNGGDYGWYDTDRCNCGLLACHLLAVTPEKLKTIRRGPDGELWDGTWSSSCNPQSGFCHRTKLPVEGIFIMLTECGLTLPELCDLEFLTNSKIRLRAQFSNHSSHRNRDDVAKYMRAWADMIEEEDLSGECNVYSTEAGGSNPRLGNQDDVTVNEEPVEKSTSPAQLIEA